MALNLQMFLGKKNFDCQKAERWFKERRIPLQLVDLNKKPLSKGEFDSVVAAVGLLPMIDQESKLYLESPLRFTSDPGFIRRLLFENQRLLKTPILRCGRKATVGFCPEVWEQWMQEAAK